MPLANTSDYQLAVNRLMRYIDETVGLEPYTFMQVTGMLPEDLKTIRTGFATYKRTNAARDAAAERFVTAIVPGKAVVHNG